MVSDNVLGVDRLGPPQLKVDTVSIQKLVLYFILTLNWRYVFIYIHVMNMHVG